MKWAEAVKAGGDVPPAYLAFTPTPRDTGSGVTGLLPPPVLGEAESTAQRLHPLSTLEEPQDEGDPDARRSV